MGTRKYTPKSCAERVARGATRRKELLEEFARLSGEDINSQNKGFMGKVRNLFGSTEEARKKNLNF